jgi:TRAP-type C4-dicarboxylate transport system substrate-binding protein
MRGGKMIDRKKSQKSSLFLVAGVTLFIVFGQGFLPPHPLGYAEEAKEKKSGEILLRFANLEPPPSLFTQAFEWWADEIGKRTQGRLRIKVYSGGLLAREKSVIEAVRVGLADAGEVVTVLSPGKTPLATVGQNPIGSSDPYVNHRAMQDLILHYSPIQKEFEKFNQKALWTQATGTQRIIAKKPIRTLADLQGMKIRASAQMGLLYKKIGASPVFIPMTEAYEGLQRGTADAASAGLLHMESIRFHEVCKHLLMTEGLGVNNAGFGTINLDRWKALPPDVQKRVLEVSNEFPNYLSHLMMISEEKILEAFKSSGVSVYALSPADKEKLRAVGKEVTEMWVKETGEKGLPGAEALHFLLDAEGKVEAEVKAKGYPWARK